MSQVVEEMIAILEGDENTLAHYGMPRRSGRYPWGSGDDPYQHGGKDFLSRVEELKKNGWTETAENIRKEFGDNVTLEDYRNEKAWCNYERRLYQVQQAKSLKSDGLNTSEIGRKMGINESTVRSLLDENREARMTKAAETADFLKKQCDEKGMIDVGKDVERELNIPRTKLDMALYKLQGEGYEVYSGGIPQVTNKGQQTIQQVLCPPGTPYKDIYKYDQIHTINDYISRDDGKTFEKKFHYPESLDSKRLKIRYSEEGGLEKDGTMEIRRGVPDLSLGESRYAQVRIMVDGSHYLKGMAVYSDGKDMPDGVDIIFNTNKKKGTPMEDVLKKIKPDPDNPFGALIKDSSQGGQYWYDAKTGKRIDGSEENPNKKLGLINKTREEGDWTEWKDSLPSQFLGKQSLDLAKKQLNIAKTDKQAEYEELCALTNPTIKKHLLKKFADDCDAAAVNLKAAALPGQKYHVIIPINTLSDNEIYAPQYKEGTKLALIRYPHGGTFEIPILTVRNGDKNARKIIGTDSIDAVGINKNIADRLSGADYDGDTVMCIPTHDRQGKVKIASKSMDTPAFSKLKGFDTKDAYQYDDFKEDSDGTKHYYRNGHEFPIMKDTQKQMGVISNLITDMTLAGASDEELVRAVKHSMVVIDAEKHKLDYKASEVENNIAALKKTYQPKYDENGNLVRYGGANTLLSRAKGEYTVEKRQGTPKTNIKGKPWYDPNRPEGALIYKTTDDLYYPDKRKNKSTGLIEIKTVDGKKISYDQSNKKEYDKYNPVKKVDSKTGETIFTNKDGTIIYATKKKTQVSTNMAETDNAYTLVSKAKHPMEIVYADYANDMKALANDARIEIANTGRLKYSKDAKEKYKKEVSSLLVQLNDAELNSIKERVAQRKANVEVNAKKEANPDWKNSDVKKASQQAITKYRQEVGKESRTDRSIKITDKEWEAIQAGAISEAQLNKILNNTDIDSLRERATPRSKASISQAKASRIKAMSASYTIAQIAEKLGVSPSTVSNYLKGKE